jgi:hypothetical protein
MRYRRKSVCCLRRLHRGDINIVLEPVLERLVIPVEGSYVRRSWLISGWILIDPMTSCVKRTRGGQGPKAGECAAPGTTRISERDRTPRSKKGDSTRRKWRRGGVWTSSKSPSSNLRVSFLKSQINRYNLARCENGATLSSSPTYLTSSTQPDNKVTHVVGVAQV